MSKKKSGLSKEISSIFEGMGPLPERGVSGVSEKSPSGRNHLIPLEKSFVYFAESRGAWASPYQAILEIGFSSLKWICLEDVKENPRVVGMAYLPFSEMSLSSKNLKDIENFLQQVKKKARGIRSLRVFIGEPFLSFHFLPISKMNRRYMKEVVINELMRRSPNWQLQESFADFFISKEPSREKIGHLHVTAACVKKNELEKWTAVIQRAGWAIKAVEGLPFAFEPLVREIGGGGAEDVTALINMETSLTSLSFFRSGVLEYERLIPVSLQDFSEALERPLIGVEGRLQLTTEEAQTLLWTSGIPVGEGELQMETSQGKKISSTQVTGLIRPVLEKFVQELDRSIRFYLRTYQLASCQKIFLTGRGALLPQFIASLKNDLKFEKMEFLRPFDALKLDENVTDLDQINAIFRMALGGALLKEKKLDLRPLPLKQDQHWNRFQRMFTILSIFLLALISILIFFDHSKLKNREKWFDRTYGNFLKAKSTFDRIETLQMGQEKLKRMSEDYEQAVGRFPAWEYLLKELSLAIHEEVILAQLKIAKDKEQWVFLMKGHILSGTSSLEGALSEFLIRLGEAKSLTEVNLLSSQRRGTPPHQDLEFEIKCKARERVKHA
ncbi:MAG: pilus assembly protein PilM [Chlamydiae bacterium]|nr:pilus assembly protein PilM [Chlamydiota bacterium]MBI3277151.1 pilus assembly protein PilM [Chlamydiota bacterium]